MADELWGSNGEYVELMSPIQVRGSCVVLLPEKPQSRAMFSTGL